MTNLSKKILVTSALPYANGSIHLGHILEFIQTDIWVRLQNLTGNKCIYVCGDDAHGTPIMLHAEKLGITPEELIKRCHNEHYNDIKDFNISLNNFYTTHSDENKELSAFIYNTLQDNGDIIKRTIIQAFDPKKNIFLPDRYVKGECPKCNTKDQYGDSCEACGAHYSPTDLINPVSAISGATPIEKESLHFFFKLSNYEKMLKTWTNAGHLQAQVIHKLNEWFEQGLQEWDISRDGPYFGFEIPGEKNKYFYVWLDAPIGYIASFKNLCKTRKDLNFDEFWQENSPHELYHFIGKDIVYFHALFWPAMLKGSKLRTPNNIFVHGFLTVNGEKMSKSRGTFITARQYLKFLDPEYLRYYFAAKLSDNVEDLDLNFEDFCARVNSDLVGKFVNIASRCAGFINKKFNSTLCDKSCVKNMYKIINKHNKEDKNINSNNNVNENISTNNLEFEVENQLFNKIINKSEIIKQDFLNRKFSKAVREIMSLTDDINKYIDNKKPWVLIKTEKTLKEAHAVCSFGLNLFKVIATYLKPITPQLIKKCEEFLNVDELNWNNIDKALINHKINAFTPLMQRIELKKVNEMVEQNESEKKQEEREKTNTNQAFKNEKDNKEEIVNKIDHNSEVGKNPLADLISIEDFMKVDLRVVKIIEANNVEGADKLLQLKLDLGGNLHKQVFAGIKSAYNPEKLIGKMTVMVANLKPRKMRFGLSEGMILAAGPGGEDLWLLEPDSGAAPGMRLK